jgi:hypothetical protein
MSKVAMICPNGDDPVPDEELSNENWKVFKNPCPRCGSNLEVVYE